MEVTDKVLTDVRNFLNIDSTSKVFDSEIIPHIMSAVGRLFQNGAGSPTSINDDTTWSDIIPSTMLDNEEVFAMIPLYVMLSTKVIFDPPPPSLVEYYKSMLDENLWRLRFVYDTNVGGDINDK